MLLVVLLLGTSFSDLFKDRALSKDQAVEQTEDLNARPESLEKLVFSCAIYFREILQISLQNIPLSL